MGAVSVYSGIFKTLPHPKNWGGKIGGGNKKSERMDPLKSAGFMLKKENKLKKDKEFDNVFKKGRPCFNKNLGIKAVANGLKLSRFGILVSNKISKKAVERNQIKRRIRAIISPEINKLKKGYDIVVITLPPILGNTYQEMEAAIKNGFKKLGLYR
jgi:ribonuclease P protein component